MNFDITGNYIGSGLETSVILDLVHCMSYIQAVIYQDFKKC